MDIPQKIRSFRFAGGVDSNGLEVLAMLHHEVETDIGEGAAILTGRRAPQEDCNIQSESGRASPRAREP